MKVCLRHGRKRVPAVSEAVRRYLRRVILSEVEPVGRRRRDLGGRTDRKICEFARKP